MNEPTARPGTCGAARSEGVASDLQPSSQVFPYGAPVCLDPLRRGMHVTKFAVPSQDTNDSSAVVRSQGPEVDEQTSSCALKNETIGSIVRTPIDSTYGMLDSARFFIHRPTTTILHQMQPLTLIGQPERQYPTHLMLSSNRTTGTAAVCPATNEFRRIFRQRSTPFRSCRGHATISLV